MIDFEDNHCRELPRWLGYCAKHDRVYPVNCANDHIQRSKCSMCDSEDAVNELCGKKG